MDKMRMETRDGAARNIDALAKLFPACVTETADGKGGLKKAVDFARLKEILGENLAEEGHEAYEFTWVGKKAAILEANRPITKTLRPAKEESRDWDTTENLYIEGDNLDVLKLLQESYLGGVKCIYIDPPYNTGNDFIYRDDFKTGKDEYEEAQGLFDEEENRLVRNTDTNGRFHSDWCSMIYPRLVLARNLLAEDGVIFISIDDHELANLKNVCDEVFGASNFVAVINWRRSGGRQDSKYFAVIHEYVLCYAKNIAKFTAGEEIKHGEIYPKYDAERGRYYKTQLLRKWGSNSLRENRPNLYYPIKGPDGSEVYPIIFVESKKPATLNFEKIQGRWRWSASTLEKAMKEGRVEFQKNKYGEWVAYEKIYAPEKGEENTKKYSTWVDDVSNGTGTIKDLFSSTVFDYSKSPELLLRFLKMADLEDGDVVLDFFSGSATTAHAVMQLNAEDGGHRKFILVQLPEPCDEKSEAYKAGFKNICEIGKERIRRAGDKIRAEHPDAELDTGFRVLKLASSNMKDVYFVPEEYTQEKLLDTESNIKEDRTGLDLFFSCLLEWGLPLSHPITTETVDGCAVYTYGGNGFTACFEKNIPESVIRAMAGKHPLRAVFRDAAFAGSPEKINVFEIFKLLSPDTTVKVI